MTDDKKAELLLVHYNDTFQHILFHWNARNRLFFFILCLMLFMTLDITSPQSFPTLLRHWVYSQVDMDKQATADDSKGEASNKHNHHELIRFDAITSAVWFVLLCLVINYYQRSIHVDRQYRYIEGVEEQICELLGEDSVTREGRSYKSISGSVTDGEGRPFFLKLLGAMYTNVFPIVLLCFVVFKLISEWLQYGLSLSFDGEVSWGFICDLGIAIGLLCYTFGYGYSNNHWSWIPIGPAKTRS